MTDEELIEQVATGHENSTYYSISGTIRALSVPAIVEAGDGDL